MGKSTKDNRDIFYRSAKQEGWRARSAFKLLNIDKSRGGEIFRNVKRVVDLCAAPGSWSQVLSQHVYMPQQNDPAVRLVAVDFQFMVPIPGVTQLQGDITEIATAERILAEFHGEKADLVVCDGAPDVTGFHDLDIYRHHDIVVAALAITTAILKEGGTLIMKVFKKKDDDLLADQISTFFREVSFVKPEGSRDSSLEEFAVGTGHFTPSCYEPYMLLDYLAKKSLDSFRNTRVPFIVYGETAWTPEMEEQHQSWLERQAKTTGNENHSSNKQLTS
ncbi:putative tRNA (cytidine(32)/guanosine(34)-2'-O)-methyltransferase 1 [Hypsibius exemplaris]|uniref:tRNA (Cytidine(32)/guanosine(34)-2'-O)-methyltransferase 1 n=1 Tax=Hypsibius exemplaris TaxID=2072580 RepID=A0A1W0WXX3_HYPEX|nr:putative tRNA (cytidine(32)/guanosine(34)-2'-O)-methyltransferase 1 [Hypsibius exemplaris]